MSASMIGPDTKRTDWPLPPRCPSCGARTICARTDEPVEDCAVWCQSAGDWLAPPSTSARSKSPNSRGGRAHP